MADYDRRNETSLRGKIIRLAHENPELRPHLLPLVVKGAARDLEDKRVDPAYAVKKIQRDWEGARGKQVEAKYVVLKGGKVAYGVYTAVYIDGEHYAVLRHNRGRGTQYVGIQGVQIRPATAADLQELERLAQVKKDYLTEFRKRRTWGDKASGLKVSGLKPGDWVEILTDKPPIRPFIG